MPISDMEIAVVGPGAIGCLFAAYLTRAGGRVWLLDHRPERAKVLRERGITVESERTGFHARMKVTATPTEIRSAELFILCVKANNTADAAARLKDSIPPQSHLLTLQNGLGNVERLGEFFGSSQILAGTTSHGATLLEVGRVRHAGYGEIFMGETGGGGSTLAGTTKLQNLAATFNRAGLEAQVVDDIESVLWRKLVVNVGINALTAILDVPNGELSRIRDCQSLMNGAVREAVEVARHCGIELDVLEEIERVKTVCRSTSANISSMLQDVRRKKKTEIDQLNGVVIEMAARYGITAPVNEVLTAIVRSLEAGYRSSSS
ncbi:MAG: 2-dehydropantoate 2-reductase [Deltaproteobacteria bacterium]|jgi:2-dehydropantoate 2-reductase